MIALIMLYFSINVFQFSDAWNRGLIFCAGLMFCLHVVLSAKKLKGEGGGPFSTHYLFYALLMFVTSVFFLAALSHFVLPGFSFRMFYKDFVFIAGDIYQDVYHYFFRLSK
jgi:hypothetical protein